MVVQCFFLVKKMLRTEKCVARSEKSELSTSPCNYILIDGLQRMKCCFIKETVTNAYKVININSQNLKETNTLYELQNSFHDTGSEYYDWSCPGVRSIDMTSSRIQYFKILSYQKIGASAKNSRLIESSV